MLEDVEEETEGPTSTIVNPFDPEDIDVITRTPNVNLLLSRLKSNRLDLEPDFQRKSGIWNAQRMSRLIESLLLKIPLPTMYAAESQEGDDRWIIVDGVQRISTIASFVNPSLVPKLKFSKLVGLEYLDEYEEFSYEDLSPRLQTRIQETEFILNLIRRGTPEPVMFNIFARINTGGAPLTRQELRHALTPGEGRVLLRELAESPAFKRATGGRVRSDRMEDREMILRFIAFYLAGVDSYTLRTDFDGFLTAALKELSGIGPRRRATVAKVFTRALGTAEAIFGNHAFRKSLPGDDRRAPVNKALFEAVLVSLARLTVAQQRAVSSRAKVVVDRFRELLSDADFVAAISSGTGDYRKVQLRHDRVREAFK